MGRILFFVLLGIALYVAFRIWRIGQRRGDDRGAPRATGGEDMVRCRHCGLNLPRSEAVGEAGDWYCSAEHRRLGRSGS